MAHHYPAKRKASSESSCFNCSLETAIKRVRITSTPGEIRLKKDLKEIQGMKELRLAVELTDNPASVILNFDVGDDDSIPSSFLVEVPRYYPHSRPVVTCLQERFRSTRYIGSSREVLHSTLCEKGWSAIDSLSTVIDILFQIIATYYHDYGPNESVVTASGAMDTDEEHLFP